MTPKDYCKYGLEEIRESTRKKKLARQAWSFSTRSFLSFPRLQKFLSFYFYFTLPPENLVTKQKQYKNKAIATGTEVGVQPKLTR